MISIRSFYELTNLELYQIIKSRIEIFSIEQNSIYQDLDDKDLEAYHLFVKDDKDNDKIIAYLRILNKGISYKECSIGRVIVDKKYRKKGIARMCMKRAIDFIENQFNEYEIRISAQKYISDFYESLGFIKISDFYIEDGLPHIEMLYRKK